MFIKTHSTLIARMLIVGTLTVSAVASWVVTGAMSQTPGVALSAAMAR